MEESAIEIVLFLEETLFCGISGLETENSKGRTSGISTATSTPNLLPSIPFTEVLFPQLPTSVMLLGGANATFQLESSFGSGIEYGTDIPFFRRGRVASSGCIGDDDGIFSKNVCSVRRNCSSGGLCFSLGRTLGKSSSIYPQSLEYIGMLR